MRERRGARWAASRDEDRRRGRLLLATLAAARVGFPPGAEPPVIRALRNWLDSWASIGRIAAGMARQGYDLQLTRYAEAGWRATFYVAGKEHSVTPATASAWERTAWRAVQTAAWEALAKAEDLGPSPALP